jgi:hypothetical protein
MTTKLHTILVLHAAPKDMHQSIETYVIADDEDVILERVDSEFARDAWSERSAELGMLEIYDEKYDVIGEETFLERMKRLRGEYNDDDADFSDAHYGITHFGWDEGKDVTPAEIEMLLALNVAQDWRVPAEAA